jgi:hypothetical protein
VPTDAEIDMMSFAPLLDINGNIQSAAAQRAALKLFIAQDKYLNDLRGNYTEKYGGETPWFSQLDLRILQDLVLNPKTKQTLQFSLDFVNLGNLINSNWGVREVATTSGYYQPISVSYNSNSPIYQFDPATTSTFTKSPDLQSRWQMQVGIRYIF